jgi:4-hydroxybenzoate polyprenyltransferase and related prenyltransferases
MISFMLKALIKSMRPRQWAKNVFLLAAIVFDRQLTNPTAMARTMAGLIIFCLLSSTVYLLNDIADIEADRNHPLKRLRPIASGALPLNAAIFASVLLMLISLPAAYLLSPRFAIIAIIYFLLNLAYSKYLKHVPLIDVMILAAFYVIRVVAGVSLIQVERFSPWLYVVTTLLALYIGFGKRRGEILLLQEVNMDSTRRVLEGYSLSFLDQLITIVSGTTIVSYSLYTFSAPNLPENHTMMLTIPFVVYGIFAIFISFRLKVKAVRLMNFS